MMVQWDSISVMRVANLAYYVPHSDVPDFGSGNSNIQFVGLSCSVDWLLKILLIIMVLLRGG